MAGIAERLRVDGQVKDLSLGNTFNKAYKSSGAAAYHTIRYDFKPQSIDTQKMGTMEIIENHEVTVSVPHREGSGTSQTVFKGNEKPIAKECLLIIDHNTGEIVLERLSSQITVKKTREERGSNRPPTPLSQGHKSSPPQKYSPPHNSRGGPAAASPSRSRPSPSHHHKVSPPSKMSPQHRSNNSVPSKSPSNSFMPSMGGMGSMPMLGMGMEAPNVEAKSQESGLMSDSSSDSDSNSGSSSSSDSDSDSEPDNPPPAKKANGHSKNIQAANIQSAFGNNSDSDSDPDRPAPSPKKSNGQSGGAPQQATNLMDDLELSEDDSD